MEPAPGEPVDPLKLWALPAALVLLLAAAAVALAGIAAGDDGAVAHAAVATAAAFVAWLAARFWVRAPLAPERLARLLVVAAFLLLALAQLLAGIGAWSDVANDAGGALSRLAVPLALLAAVAALGALLARSRRDARRW
jgi:hypothetical protein